MSASQGLALFKLLNKELKMTKQIFAGIACIFFMVALPVCAEEADKSANFENNRQKTSYALGAQTARTFVKDNVDIDIDQFIKGLKDSSGGKPLLLSEAELQRVLNGFQSDLRRNLKTAHAIAAAENIRKGKAFLDENKKKPDVVTMTNGLQYRVIKAGNGKIPVDTDTVEVNYRGATIDGKQFDANEPGAPATMQVAQLIPGMKQALKLMPAGSHWEIVIPSQLAYGPRAVGAEIGPNETLIFDMELVSIK
jgi:FKBP-type peptidyl-prolyl cis-trans isomerase